VAYKPPTGEALVLLTATLQLNKGSASIAYADISGPGCAGQFDEFATTQAFSDDQHTYPAGLPIAQLVISLNGFSGTVMATGYLIPKGQLPH
jgi:hypothetical protein